MLGYTDRKNILGCWDKSYAVSYFTFCEYCPLLSLFVDEILLELEYFKVTDLEQSWTFAIGIQVGFS